MTPDRIAELRKLVEGDRLCHGNGGTFHGRALGECLDAIEALTAERGVVLCDDCRAQVTGEIMCSQRCVLCLRK